jgi:hypothetical protein
MSAAVETDMKRVFYSKRAGGIWTVWLQQSMVGVEKYVSRDF